MKLDKKGLDLIASFEGLRLKPYLCSAGVPTIGYGNTYYEDGTKVAMSNPAISKERAVLLLKLIVKDFEDIVNKYVKKDLTQNQFNSLVSLVYNIGGGNFKASTLLKLVINNPNDANIAKQFLRWNKARVNNVLTEIKGLTKRRIKESANYFTK
jgi:lysozyme